jgi:ABC-type uncharacterized transport system fused permease/ATPase subunit
VIGTLIDQLTYPDTTGGEALNKERMIEILDAVDLTHLMDRKVWSHKIVASVLNLMARAQTGCANRQRDRVGGPRKADQPWGILWRAVSSTGYVAQDELSLGEKQRLAIARLLHHKPRFAILDECSSAITSDMEQRMYKVCDDEKITYITIAHRPVLRAYQ